MGTDVAVNLFARVNEAVAGLRNSFAKSLLLGSLLVQWPEKKSAGGRGGFLILLIRGEHATGG
ncbi:hypothetical protein RBSH_00377 [Rhodopirellula baltica SH28]|uniref:Uncharacterized protein n=1 Tax=Rhodopirellula baltica SH28 TaxID=993517 RepID=K5CJV0_RHOBT|nr:hypothetical protein RBSH_00377 [Rhodopirellula baltica SH28]